MTATTTKAVVVDTGAMVTLIRSMGYHGLDMLWRSGDTILLTTQVFNEMVNWPGADFQDRALIQNTFKQWYQNNEYLIARADIDNSELGEIPTEPLYERDPATGKVIRGPDGPNVIGTRPTQVGDLSIKAFFENPEHSGKFDATILSNDRGLIEGNFAQRKPWGSTNEFMSIGLIEGWVGKDEYIDYRRGLFSSAENKSIPDYKYERYENGEIKLDGEGKPIIKVDSNGKPVRKGYTDLLFEEADVARFEQRAVQRALTVYHPPGLPALFDNAERLSGISTAAKIFRQAGIAGDVLGFAVTAARAMELAAAGDKDGANKVWVGYFGGVAGGFLGTMFGSGLAGTILSATSIAASSWAGIVIIGLAGLAGGIAGDAAGTELAEYIYDELTADDPSQPITPERIIELYGEFQAQGEYELPEIDLVELSLSEAWSHCFAAGTPIDLADGSQKPIKQVKVGDVVLAYDPENENGVGELAPRRVTRTYATPNKLVLDFHGLKVTPGHAFLCGDGPHKGQHRMLIDILRDDGAVVAADGRVLRAATNASLGSREDAFLQVRYLPAGANSLLQEGRLRAGTLLLTDEGETASILQLLEAEGYTVTQDGLVARDGEESHPLHWYGPLPRPEDYVLQASNLTDADLAGNADYIPQVNDEAGSLLGTGWTPAPNAEEDMLGFLVSFPGSSMPPKHGGETLH